MKRSPLRLLFLVVAIILLLGIAVFVPLPLDPYLDFQVLYRANSGIVRGIPLYDQAAQAQMVADDLGVPVEDVFVLPFPYPPWFAVVTLPLALFPIDTAVRLWLALNLIMLFASLWLLTDGWEPRKRLYSIVAGLLFLPVLGALFVGQYVFPSLLGMALIQFALRYERAGWLALGMGLATFKPHTGIFVLGAVLVFLLFRRDPFGARSLRAIGLVGVLLFFLGFLADGNWPVSYLRSLFQFRTSFQCQLCVSLPNTIAQLGGIGFDHSVWIAALLLLILIALFLGSRYRSGDALFLAFFVCVTLLVNPYLQNYDFAFALVPLFYLIGSARSVWDWVWVSLLFFVPWIGLGVFGRQGNFVLLGLVVVMALIILTRLYKRHTIVS
jgi:hypothetical protein